MTVLYNDFSQKALVTFVRHREIILLIAGSIHLSSISIENGSLLVSTCCNVRPISDRNAFNISTT